MYLEDLYLPIAFVLLILGISIIIAIEIPELYVSLHLGFIHFVGSLIMLVLAIIFMLLDHFLGWGSYIAPTFPSRTVRTETTKSNSNPHKHRPLKLDYGVNSPPTKKELQRLKEALGLDVGSLQYKRRGMGIYHVVYAMGKHKWHFIGPWYDLKAKLEG